MTEGTRVAALASEGRLVLDGRPIAFRDGDSIAVAIVREGEHPARGGTLCLSGDCGSCVAEVDGVPWVRTCKAPARPGLVVRRHPGQGLPLWRAPDQADLTRSPAAAAITVEHRHVDVVVVGGGRSGMAAAAAAEGAGEQTVVLDAAAGHEVVAVEAGPTVIARTPGGMLHVHAHRVVIATGSAEWHPVCLGSDLAGIITAGAAARLHAAGVDLGVAVAVGEPPAGVPCGSVEGRLVRIEGTGRVTSVVTGEADGAGATAERRTPCDTLIVGLGSSGRDVLARMTDDPGVSIVGSAARAGGLPAPPTSGVVCPCKGITVDDLDSAWERGYRELELLKRASLAGTGTCQGGACLPHLRAFVADRSGGTPPDPFTARPAARQVTLAEAAAGVHPDAFRRTALHEQHLALGARMDRFGGWWRPWHYGDPIAEYWAVREGVSLGDVSTLGKLVVSGPDAVEALERLYPIPVGDLRPGRARYTLLLNERGHVIDDGMICRESDTRFLLTFTSAGAGFAELWIRDWLETWGLRVHLLDRTMSLGAINVTGPLAGRLLERSGLTPLPRFLDHRHAAVAGVPCHVMRVSFTGEASFELHCGVDRSVELWEALMAEGADLGIAPHGLQALQALRLEKGHVIVGVDTELDSTPRRLGMDWAARLDKPWFVGRGALLRTQDAPDQRRLVGLAMAGPAPIDGSPIRDRGDIVGHVTSAFDSPVLGHAVMLGWLKRAPFPVQVEIDGRLATVVPTPFYDPEGTRARA